MARDFERQGEEILIRIAVLNRYNSLGISVTESVGKFARSWAMAAYHPICATKPRMIVNVPLETEAAGLGFSYAGLAVIPNISRASAGLAMPRPALVA